MELNGVCVLEIRKKYEDLYGLIFPSIDSSCGIMAYPGLLSIPNKQRSTRTFSFKLSFSIVNRNLKKVHNLSENNTLSKVKHNICI